jgi:hypothetical protein
VLVGWDVNMPNFVAQRAKQRKARRGNQREANQRVKKKEAREMEGGGGGVLGAFFFLVFNFLFTQYQYFIIPYYTIITLS